MSRLSSWFNYVLSLARDALQSAEAESVLNQNQRHQGATGYSFDSAQLCIGLDKPSHKVTRLVGYLGVTRRILKTEAAANIIQRARTTDCFAMCSN